MEREFNPNNRELSINSNAAGGQHLNLFPDYTSMQDERAGYQFNNKVVR